MQPKLEKSAYMKKIILFFSACVLSISAFAVMATPEPITKTQADGSKVTLRLMGDEFHHYYVREDGKPVSLNDKGFWTEDETAVRPTPSALMMRKNANRNVRLASYPLSGSPKSIVILVNFSDVKFQYKQEDFQQMLNQSGYSENGGVGSARDYFIACSDSVFSPQFDCYGPVTLNNTEAYYDSHHAQMVVHACNMVAEEGVDMTQYDTDNDGRLDNVFIYYAGHNEAEGAASTTIWPHRSVVPTGDRVQGKLIYDYACTSELRGSAGNSMCGIGTFCHEFGHVLGLPDYYDTENSSTYTIGTWDIMCSGSYNGNGKTPPTHTAGERFQLGWTTPIQLDAAGSYVLEPVETSNKVYLIAKTTHNLSFDNADPNEYWLLENRQNVGWDRHATSLPGTGMLIWHVDYSTSAWGSNKPNNDTPLRYDVEEAGSKRGYSAPSDPFPGTSNVMQFTPMLHNGEMLEQPLTSIAQDGLDIVFTFKSSDFMFVPAEIPVIKSTYNTETKEAYTPASLIKAVGVGLEPNAEVSLDMSGSGFKISLDSAKWSTSATVLSNADSTLDVPVYIQYAPRKQVCDTKRGTLTIKQGNKSGTLIVYGTSPRPVLIEAPQVTEIDDVTPTTFKVQWTPQKDAQEYYVTLFHMEDGTESTMESFENFDDEVAVQESGWYTSFYRTTTKAKEDGAVSMWFKENNEFMISPIYSLPVIELSIWLNAPATTDSEVGFFTLTGYSDMGIDTIDVIKVTKNTKKYTYTKSFTRDQGYRRFGLDYTSIGGEGVCLDAFTTTFDQKTVYTYKGREKTIPVEEGKEEEAASFYAYDLTPNTVYYIRLQCEENKGCEEHVSQQSMEVTIATKAGEPADSKHMTLDLDSLDYDPATHVVYIPQSLENGAVNIYNTEGELIKSIPVEPTQNIVVLPEGELTHGTVYLLKYIPNNKMRRKGPWLKILF